MRVSTNLLPMAVMSIMLAACSGENAEKAASGAVSKAVELAKGAATGASKGVDDGRKASTSIDGAVIVSSGAELKASLTGGVLAAQKDDATLVTLGFANEGAAPVRVTELSQGGHVTGLDGEGYACTTLQAGDEFTVPAKAKLKVEMRFDCTDKTLAKVRLYDVEYAVAP
ncbi:MAG: hypothetical protein JNJ62_00170 [Pseudoxanthomonas mexicana]|jgi:hypothetical protein|uniref:hypothetical protein n=1 Tax=Pseudoxanthomonas mexicana TaxID=128785 RepID=UPI000B171F57|nr:hypothetical protein [Pseudoxanthomonas mexicana]MBL8254994.1 hypothetical protein [Pseudoxanthomonas mexicana]